MSLFSFFYPDDYYQSTYDIDFNALYAEGYRSIIFDIDNTLVPHGAPSDARSRQLISQLKKIGFKTLVLSNNKEPRVKKFANSAGVDYYIYKANKPAKSGYKDAVKRLGTEYYNTLFIGDQIFTDVWGAKRTGLRSILVAPVEKWKEEPQIILKRFLEAPIIWSFKRYIGRGGE